MKLSTFGWIFFVLTATGVSCLQSFDREPEYTEVNPGEDAKLTCVILNKKGTCMWDKDSKPVGIYAKKYEWAASGNNQESTTGDCSLWIRSATLQFDDGHWECRVTPSDFTSQDSLVSKKARLVVRVAPQWPRIEHNASQVLPGHNVTVRQGEKAVLKCVSRYGNPPAVLKWFLGDEEIEAKSNQTNTKEEDNDRTWMATSTVEVRVDRPHHGNKIRCVALHESYPAKSQSVEVKLDVTYPPEVRLVGIPNHDLEEGKDNLILRCIADANPAASVVWRRVGSNDISSLSDSLQFKPVNQRDSGTYSCVAKNPAGTSQPLTATLDIKYAPIIKSVGPDKVTTAHLYSSAEFSCAADGNPAPTYQWFQKVALANGTPQDTVIIRSSEPKLRFKNITYEYQGEYVCVVTNNIAGSDRTVQSQPITLQVIGAPQVMKHSEKLEVIAQRGENALIVMVVCSDPRPRKTVWEWGSMQLEAGAGLGRYRAEELLQEGREDCYEARFHVYEVDHGDARNYYLTVENERGVDRRPVRLAVRGSYTEPLPMMTVLSIAAGSLSLFVLCVLLSVYIIRSEKCCFSRKCDFKPAESECEKSDMNNTLGHKIPKIEPVVNNGPADITYGTSSPARRPPPPTHAFSSSAAQGSGGSPEAMKKKRRNLYQNSGKRSSRRHKRRNTYDELQVPSVSNNGATINRVSHCYSSRKMLAYDNSNDFYEDDEISPETSYFCPVAQRTNYDLESYNDVRTFPRHGYRPTYDEKEII